MGPSQSEFPDFNSFLEAIGKHLKILSNEIKESDVDQLQLKQAENLCKCLIVISRSVCLR